MARKKKLDTSHWHEALDRSYLVMEMFNEYVATHPAVEHSAKLRDAAGRLSDELFAFYQLIGSAFPEFDSAEPEAAVKPKRRPARRKK